VRRERREFAPNRHRTHTQTQNTPGSLPQGKESEDAT